MNEHDALLLERWSASKDPDAFHELMDRYVDLVYSTARRILRNDDDAMDVSQECFLRLLQSARDVRTSVGAWLHASATHRALDHIRAESRRRAREDSYSRDEPQHDVIAWDDISELVDEAIAALPDEYRVPVIAHYFERKSYVDLSEELGVARQTVSARVRKGVEQIRERLNAGGRAVSAAPLGSLLLTHGLDRTPDTLRSRLAKYALSGLSIEADLAVPANSGANPWLTWGVGLGIAALILLGLFGVTQQMSPNDNSGGTPVGVTAVPVETPDPTDSLESTPATLASEPAPRRIAQAVAAADDSTETPEVARTGPGSVFVQVVLQNGSPVANAEVTLEHITWDDFVTPPPTVARWVVETDESGGVLVENLPLGEYGCLVQTDSAAMVDGTLLTQQRTRSDMYLRLFPGRPMEGIVRDSAGNPVPNATVYPEGSPVINRAPFSAFAVMRKQTDDEGRFYFPVFPPIAFSYCIVSEDGMRTVTPPMANRGAPLEMTQYAGGYVSGQILQEGSDAGLESTRIAVAGGPGGLRTETTTDGEGHFIIGPVQQGEYRVEVTEPGIFVADIRPISVPDGGTVEDVRIEASTGVALTGSVTEAESGGGVRDVVVSVYRIDTTGQSFVAESEPTDASGAFAVFGLGPGSHMVRASATGPYFGASETVDISLEGEPSSVELQMEKGVLITGRVLESSGTRSSQYLVIAQGPSDERVGSATSRDEAGDYMLRFKKSAGQVKLKALAVYGSSEWTELIDLEERDIHRIDLHATLPRDSRIRGRIVNTAGQPLPLVGYWAIMDLTTQSSTIAGRLSISELDGSIELANLHADTYSIIAGQDNRYEARELGERVEVEQGETVENIEIVFGGEPTGTMEGRVMDASGAPISGVRISAQGRRAREAETSQDGTFRIGRIGEEAYLLTLRHPSYTTEFAGPVTAGGPPLTITMQPAVDLSVTVVDASTGAPIPRVALLHTRGRLVTDDRYATLTRPNGQTFYPYVGEFVPMSSDSGEYVWPNTDAGDTVLGVIADGYAPAIQNLDIPFGVQQTSASVRLQPGATIRGRVVDASGAPVAGAYARLETGAQVMDFGNRSTETDASGEFVMDQLTPGIHDVHVSANGYVATQAELVAESGRTGMQTVVLDTGGALEVRVTDPRPPGLSPYVLVSEVGGDGLNRAASLESGGFGRMDGLSPGRYEAQVRCRVGDTRTVAILSAPVEIAGSETTSVEMSMPSGEQSIAGRVTRNGVAVVGAIVEAHTTWSDGSRYALQTFSAEDGSYQLDGVLAGDVSIRASLGDAQSNLRSLKVQGAVQHAIAID